MNNNDLDTSVDIGEKASFFDYIVDQGLQYDTCFIEDFLLSLKSKQFLILCGGTGTGKTKIAKEYGEYLTCKSPDIVDFPITVGKGMKNNGYTLSREIMFSHLPPSASSIEGKYDYLVDGLQGKADIELFIRFWFDRNDPNRDRIFQRLGEIKEKNDGKAVLSLKMPSLKPGYKNYVIVPVGSNWTDNRHILGYRNAITKDYHHTEALDIVIESNHVLSRPFLLVLDEMNLSHVERYFSDFLSCMESGEPILLDSNENSDVPPFLELKDNLFVIGTVNIDETTYMFSPKVLDRANVLEFESASVSDYLLSETENNGPVGDISFLQDCLKGLECRTMSAKMILKEICAADGNTVFKDSIVSDLDSIQGIMSSMKLPFGFRTLDEVMRFMYVAWIYEGRGEFVNWKRYFDSQIKQKILPKIHGNSSISTPLRELGKLCADGGYNRSAAKIQKMSAVLESQRYVSFNC